MGKQVTIRVSPQQYEAYVDAAKQRNMSVSRWALNVLLSAADKVETVSRCTKKSAPLKIEKRDRQIALWLSNTLEPLVLRAAGESCVSVTTWCMLVLDAAAGVSRLSHYLNKV